MKILKKYRGALALILALGLTAGAASAAAVETAVAVCYVDAGDREQILRSLTTAPLYTAADGEMVPCLAELPVDVTAEYAGNEIFGIPADAERGYAFKIALRSDVFWDDGRAVNSEDVLQTLQMLLEDYNWICNARGYLQGWERPAESVVSLGEAGFDSVEAAEAAGYSRFYLDVEQFWGLDAGWESITDRTRIVDYAMPEGLSERYVTPAYLYRNYLAAGTSLSWYQRRFVGVAQTKELLTLSDVGLLANGEFELVVITQEATTARTVAARLAQLQLYSENESSYGPYRIISADADEILLERNACWQGNAAEYPADTLRCLIR